jgi:hypothetical protein
MKCKPNEGQDRAGQLLGQVQQKRCHGHCRPPGLTTTSLDYSYCLQPFHNQGFNEEGKHKHIQTLVVFPLFAETLVVEGLQTTTVFKAGRYQGRTFHTQGQGPARLQELGFGGQRRKRRRKVHEAIFEGLSDFTKIPIPPLSASELPAGCPAGWPEVVVSISRRRAKPNLPKAGWGSLFFDKSIPPYLASRLGNRPAAQRQKAVVWVSS